MSDHEQDTIWIVTGEVITRGSTRKQLKVSEITEHINQFLSQMSTILTNTPTQIGQFQFSEFEIHAEVTAKGSLAILGTGGEAGAGGGLKFVFRRTDATDMT